MNLKEIREMINLMNENDLMELEVEREGTKIKIRKSAGGGQDAYRIQPPEFRIESTPHAKPSADSVPAPSGAAGTNTVQIESPMVGTFYRTPSPEAPPFVEVGQTVEVGQVVCIVEAMKLMNEIKSEVHGKVVEVSVENAEPVEFGQTLFVIEPL